MIKTGAMWMKKMIQAIKIFLLIFYCIKFASGNECGVKKVNKPTNLVLGQGTEDSYRGQWPWLASLYVNRTKGTSNKYIFCGASLINEWTLISAAHCFTDKFDFMARLGGYNILDDSEVDINYVDRSIKKTIKHDDFSDISAIVIHEGTVGAKSDADIAILIMDEAVTYTNYIIPICLPSSTVNAFNVDGFVAGHGIVNIVTRARSNTPKHVAMSTVSLDECFSSHKDSTITVSTRSFCAKGKKSAPCQGDSGGGFYTHEKKSSRWTLLGIVSFSINDECNANDYTAFTRIPLFMDFIIEKSKGIVDFPDFYQCKDNTTIQFRRKCDGTDDCGDGSDEKHCVSGSVSNSTTFSVSKFNKVDNPLHTIKSPRNIKISKFEIIDNRAVNYLPVRIGEVFPNLENYDVQWCGIKYVIRENFALLYKLRVVNLKKNWIEEVAGDAFQELNDLEELYLSTNMIRDLPDDIFKSTINLKRLSLRENEISTISQNTFKNLFKLEFLDLNLNKLKEIRSEFFTDNKKLKNIILRNNQLEKIYANIFNELNDLENLDLRCNTCYNSNFTKFNEDSKLELYQALLTNDCNNVASC